MVRTLSIRYGYYVELTGFNMQPLSRDDLFPLETYAERRGAFRTEVIEHKRRRKVPLGANITLLFEDRLTVQYQIQEMLRVERIFERSGIEEELAAYNPLIPDGSNLKATMMVEFEDSTERRAALMRLRGVEDCIWLEVSNGARVLALADEDLDRSNDEKTSAVHFLRFELPQAALAMARDGGAMRFGVDHPHCQVSSGELSQDVRAALAVDLLSD
ncbi:MAG: hypothetical protein ACI8PT_004892 [Gammaproteobacteria bacterium]|jgi:hypothetical protein